MISLIKRLQAKFSLLLDALILEKNQGKGGAIYSGWDQADPEKYKWIAFVDADGAISPQETLNFLSQTQMYSFISTTVTHELRSITPEVD